MRLLYVLIPVFVLAACGPSVPPAPTRVAQAQIGLLSLPALMETPERWSGTKITLIAPLLGGASGRVLAIDADGSAEQLTSPTIEPQRSLWLAAPLPAAVAAKATGNPIYLKLRGRLSPPGGYGSGARFPYQFSADTAAVLQSERTTLKNLAENPRSIDNALLEVTGTLLSTGGGALLADHVSNRGVPAPDARQIKLRGPIPAQATANLHQSGEVRYGDVSIVGWWHDGALAPFAIHSKAAGSIGPRRQAD